MGIGGIEWHPDDRQRDPHRHTAAGDYWLYVIDRCADGAGNVFGVYRDPIAVFVASSRARPSSKYRVPALKAAVEKGVGE